jgi:hypothetical protein
VPLLLAAEERPLPPEQIPTFGGYLSCPGEETVLDRHRYRRVPVSVHWGFNKAPRVAVYPNFARVSLPISLPDDRRTRTRIEEE